MGHSPFFSGFGGRAVGFLVDGRYPGPTLLRGQGLSHTGEFPLGNLSLGDSHSLMLTSWGLLVLGCRCLKVETTKSPVLFSKEGCPSVTDEAGVP